LLLYQGNGFVGKVRCQGQFGGPGDHDVRAVVCPGDKRFVGAGKIALSGFGAVHPQGCPLGIAEIDPGHQRTELLSGGPDQLLSRLVDALLCQTPPQVPDLCAIGAGVAGDGQSGSGFCPQTVTIKPVWVMVLDHDLMQWSALHLWSGYTEFVEHGFIALPPGQYKLASVKPTGLLVVLEVDGCGSVAVAQPASLLPVNLKNASGAAVIGQRFDHRGHIENHIHQLIEAALEGAVLENSGTVFFGDLVDSPTGRLAGEKSGHPRQCTAAGPNIKMIAENGRPAEINVAFAREAGPPVVRHVGNGFRGTGDTAAEGVFDAAVNHALAGGCLIATQRGLFKQYRIVASLDQPVEQPETGDTTTNNGDIATEVGVVLVFFHRKQKVLLPLVER